VDWFCDMVQKSPMISVNELAMAIREGRQGAEEVHNGPRNCARKSAICANGIKGRELNHESHVP
jgi:hypothetical protein